MQLLDVFPFIPLLFGLLVLVIPKDSPWVRIVPIIGAVVALGISVGFVAGYFAIGSTSTTDSVHPWIAGPWSFPGIGPRWSRATCVGICRSETRPRVEISLTGRM